MASQRAESGQRKPKGQGCSAVSDAPETPTSHLRSPVQVAAALLLTNVPAKAIAGGPGAWAPATRAGDSDRLPGFGLAQSPSLWASGR